MVLWFSIYSVRWILSMDTARCKFVLRCKNLYRIDPRSGINRPCLFYVRLKFSADDKDSFVSRIFFILLFSFFFFSFFSFFIFSFLKLTSTRPSFDRWSMDKICQGNLPNTWNHQGLFNNLVRALRPTFEKLFTGIKVQPRHRGQIDRATSMIYAMRPTFMKSTPGVNFSHTIFTYAPCRTTFCTNLWQKSWHGPAAKMDCSYIFDFHSAKMVWEIDPEEIRQNKKVTQLSRGEIFFFENYFRVQDCTFKE